ncbi:MAG: AAA family ATPase [Bdellovibrionota bacterium]
MLKQIPAAWYLDLLDPETELAYRHTLSLLRERLETLPNGGLIIIDEIQRVPSLLDYVQMAIEIRGQKFLLSGSSARKLKRGGANLLGGRAADLRLHPITVKEAGESFRLRWQAGWR